MSSTARAAARTGPERQRARGAWPGSPGAMARPRLSWWRSWLPGSWPPSCSASRITSCRRRARSSERWSTAGAARRERQRVTLTEVLLGFAIAVAAGLLTASCLHFSRIARAALYPWLIGSQTVPVVVITPVLAIIFGYTLTPKLILVALLCFFPIVVATLDGLAAVDPDLVRLMRTLYGNRWAIFRRVELPAALPSMFTGLRLSAAYAATAAVFGEYSGSSDGLGHVMRQAVPQLQSALVFAAIALLSAMSVALFVLVTVLERLLVGWAHEGKKVR